jgi:hypothetical protein
MPIDPMTGQEVPYASTYGSSGAGQLASTGARMGGVDSPLAFDMLASAPGIASIAAFNQRRGANTIMKGGFLDTNKTTGAFFRRNDQLQRFTGSGSARSLTQVEAGGRFGRGSFVGPVGYRRKKAEQLAARLRRRFNN